MTEETFTPGQIEAIELAIREHITTSNKNIGATMRQLTTPKIAELQARIEELEEEMRELEKEYKNMAAWLDEERIKVAELKEKLKTAEKWDNIESSRNEQLNARIKELEKFRINRITCGFTDCQWQRQAKRLDAALAEIIELTPGAVGVSYVQDIARKARAVE